MFGACGRTSNYVQRLPFSDAAGCGSFVRNAGKVGVQAFHVLFGEFGFDRHVSVADADVDVCGGVDSGEFGAQAVIPGMCRIEIVPGATHLFEEPGTLERAAVLAREWFTTHLPSTLSPPAPQYATIEPECPPGPPSKAT